VKKEIARDFVVYTTASYAVQVLGVVTSLAMRYFLDPPLMGVWSLLDLMMKYGLYANLGILPALNTELPIYIGKGDGPKADKIRNVAFTFTLLSSALAGIVIVLVAFVFWGALSHSTRVYMAASALILLATSGYNYYISLLWAQKKFSILGKGIVLNALIYLALIFVLVSRFKLRGLLMTAFFSTAFTTLFLHWRLEEKPHFDLNKEVFWELLKAGLPLMIVGFAYSFFMTVDRLIITRYLEIAALGQYSVAILMMTYSNTMPTLLANVIFPNLLERYGQTGSAKEISAFITKPTILLSYAMPVILGMAYFIAPYLVEKFLPKYVPGIPALRVLSLGSFFISISQPVQNYLTTIYKRLHNLPIIFLGTVSASLVSYGLISKGMGLVGVALGMSFGFFVYYVALLFYVFKHFGTFRQAFLFLAENLTCFAYLVMTVIFLETWVRVSSALFGVILKSAVFAILCLPYGYMLDKKTGALKMLQATLRRLAHD